MFYFSSSFRAHKFTGHCGCSNIWTYCQLVVCNAHAQSLMNNSFFFKMICILHKLTLINTHLHIQANKQGNTSWQHDILIHILNKWLFCQIYILWMITLQTQSNSGIKEECIDFSDFRKFSLCVCSYDSKSWWDVKNVVVCLQNSSYFFGNFYILS